MIPAKVDAVFIQITTDFLGDILSIDSGKFAKTGFTIKESIYETCPFLEGTLEALELNKPFLLEGMLIVVNKSEYNVDIELFKNKASVQVLLHNRTNVYKYVEQLNQNRNDIFFIKRQLAEKNIELEKLRNIADKANKEKSRFLAMMSHEIRNPLNTILGYAELISAEKLTVNSKNFLQNLSFSGKNLKVIVDDILDLSRIEAGKLRLVSEEITIQEIIENCIENFKMDQQNGAVELQYEGASEIPNNILGDGVRLYQILTNLIGNALKFTQKGFVKLQVKIIEDLKDTIKLKFVISDSGRGMSKAQTKKIFEEYQQNRVQDSRVLGGAGLGLVIVKRLVIAMNGTISVSSALDKGSTFSVEIPFKKVTKEKYDTIPEIKESISALKGKHILVADDDVMNQAIVKHILQKEQAKITIVNDGLEAFEKLKHTAFDLVLLDINMPNMTGEKVIQSKQKFNVFNKNTPFIALTANSTQKDIKKYMALGFREVISKPYTAKEFVGKISYFLYLK